MPNTLSSPPFAVDALYRAGSAREFTGTRTSMSWNTNRKALVLSASRGPGISKGSFISAPVRPKFAFHELIPSWNIQLDEGSQGYRVWVRVSTNKIAWSPWFYFGSGGTMSGMRSRKVTSSERWGAVNVDYLLLRKPARYFQYKVELQSSRRVTVQPELKRFFVSYSNTENDEKLHRSYKTGHLPAPTRKALIIDVPYRSQLAVSSRKLGQVICCPTCVAMSLERRGVNKTTEEVAREVYDPEHKIYGVWPRAVQVAANNGCESWIQRFRNHNEVKEMLASGQPVMASIRVNRGELSGARYKVSRGHLILLIGVRRNGDYIVNDPYCAGPKGAEIDYREADIGKVWLDKGGVGIIIRDPVEVRVA